MRPTSLSHPMKSGDVAAVLGLSATGYPYYEGLAFIRSRCVEPHLYRVRFKGDRILRTRFVNPDWQRDPERSLTLLLAFWRNAQAPTFDDFFPESTRMEGTRP